MVGGDLGDAGVDFNPDIGFAMPTEITQAYVYDDGWVDMGPADWSCLGAPANDPPTTVAVTLAGSVADFQTGNSIENGSIEAFVGGDYMTPIASTADLTDGNYSLDLPIGVHRPAFLVTTDEGLDTYQLDTRLAPGETSQDLELESFSVLTANALPAFVGVTRTPGRALTVWQILDCNGRVVKNAIATVSSTSECPTPLPDAVTYYFSGGTTPLPVRHTQQASSSADGLFMVIEMEPGPQAAVQVWGFINGQTIGDDPPVLLAEIFVPLFGDSVAIGDARPRSAD